MDNKQAEETIETWIDAELAKQREWLARLRLSRQENRKFCFAALRRLAFLTDHIAAERPRAKDDPVAWFDGHIGQLKYIIGCTLARIEETTLSADESRSANAVIDVARLELRRLVIAAASMDALPLWRGKSPRGWDLN